MRIAAISGALQGNASLTLHVSTASLPDLEVLPSALVFSPAPPPPQTPIHHTLEIFNRGVGTASATLRVWDGPRGSTLVYEWAFQVTTSRQAAFDYSYAPGTHNLTVAIDDVSPQDGDLSDNQMVVAVVVRH